jgi:putative ABC transport system permease protein
VLFFESFRIAFEALRANALRSILTTLGIIIGVTAVITVVSVVQGLEFMITGQLQDVGSNFISVLPQFERRGPGVVTRQVKLTWDDGRAIVRQVPEVELITPLVQGRLQLKYRDRHHEPDLVLGVNQDYSEVWKFFVEQGRFFSEIDLAHRRKVVVVGKEVVEALRLGDDPLGKEIYVANLPMAVIGVMEEKGQSMGQDPDDSAFVPFDTSLSLFGRAAGDQIQLQLLAKSPEVVDQVVDGVRRVLRQQHKLPEGEPDDFQIQTQDDILEAVSRIGDFVTSAAAAMVGVALLVAGIGIMNIMLVSVTERTREIGIRKSVGARRQDILWQFLIEAVALSLVGGLLGLGAGWGLGNGLTEILPGDWPPAHVPFWVVLLALGFCGLVGIFFGIYPAGKAAALDPIDALRHE